MRKLPWVCPECFAIICGPEVTQSAALEMWLTHQGGSHAGLWDQTHQGMVDAPMASVPPMEQSRWDRRPSVSVAKPSTPIVERKTPAAGRVLVPCPRCGVQVREDRIRKHLAKQHSLFSNEYQPVNQVSVPNRVQTVAGSLRPCPRCGARVRADQMKAHLAKPHAPADDGRPNPIQAPQYPPVVEALKIRRSCPRCGALVRQDCMDRHFTNNHPPDDQVTFTTGLPTKHLPFVLLPPGTWNIRQVTEHYRKVSLLTSSNDRQIDQSRLRAIESLGPVRCWTGEESWREYIAFEFVYSGRVVLECPFEGNATYVLTGDWKEIVRHTKAEIHDEFANCYTKVVHKGAWLDRIREALSV